MSFKKIKNLIHSFLPIKISYGITVCNEESELSELLNTLLPLIDDKDEVIVLQDITHESLAVSKLLESYQNKIIHIKSKLNGDFATFKNNLITAATKDYLFQIDADEIPKESLIREIKSYLAKKRKDDVFLVPRINIVNGVTDEHINKFPRPSISDF